MEGAALKKADILLIAGILLAAAMLFCAQLLFAAQGDAVVVSVNGEEIARYPLHTAVSVTLEGVGGQNRLVIENGTAHIEEADCPDKLCAQHTAISHVGDSIVCLPHLLTVTVIGSGEAPDAVVS